MKLPTLAARTPDASLDGGSGSPRDGSGRLRRLTRRQFVAGTTAAVVGAALSDACAVPPGHEKPQKWDHEADVVVIGCGISGGSAAYEAARAGAKVVVLDRGSAADNASHGMVYYLGGGTALQRALHVEDTPEEMMKYLLATNGPAPQPDKIQVYVERSVANFDWLVEMGMPFTEYLHDEPDLPRGGGLFYSGDELTSPYRDIARPAPRGHDPSVRGGRWLQARLLERLRAAGATLLLAAEAQRLVSSADGSVEGAIAVIDGKPHAFRARRAVILATGGFGFNRDMVEKHAPRYPDCVPFDLVANDGWGIRAGEAAGGEPVRMDAMAVYWALYPPMSRKQGMLVNAQGQRFMPEDAYYGHIGDVIVREQHGVAHLVVDALALGERPQWLKALHGEPDEIAAQAGTVAELERALKIPPPALQRAVELYNHYAARGEDPFFRKAREHLRPLAKPPFTALQASVGKALVSFFTLGGLRTSAAAEVLDHSGKAIPNLYAVGRAASGIPASNYYTSGLSLGECITFGRIAGARAAGRREA